MIELESSSPRGVCDGEMVAGVSELLVLDKGLGICCHGAYLSSTPSLCSSGEHSGACMYTRVTWQLLNELGRRSITWGVKPTNL